VSYLEGYLLVAVRVLVQRAHILTQLQRQSAQNQVITSVGNRIKLTVMTGVQRKEQSADDATGRTCEGLHCSQQPGL
jgi:hypothetical protein